MLLVAAPALEMSLMTINSLLLFKFHPGHGRVIVIGAAWSHSMYRTPGPVYVVLAVIVCTGIKPSKRGNGQVFEVVSLRKLETNLSPAILQPRPFVAIGGIVAAPELDG